jgi:hypothetical protein
LATTALFTASALLTTGLTASSALVLLVFIVWHFTLPVGAIQDLVISQPPLKSIGIKREMTRDHRRVFQVSCHGPPVFL